jgi:hypothetical protein
MALRTCTYESVLRGCANLSGVKRDQLLSESSSLLFEYINEAVRQFYEYDWWPELTTIELRYWRDGLWSAGTYPAGAIVYYATDGVYYENTSGGATTETPSSTASDWAEAGDFNRYVSFTQMTGTNLATAETEIDAVRNIWQSDPYINQLKGPSAFEINENGVSPLSEDFDKVWIEFKKRPADMSGMVEWDATSTYAVGDWVYYESTTSEGEAYEVIVATSAGQDPEDTPASFSKFNFPYIASPYVKRAALGMWLGAGGGGTALGDTTSSVQLASFNNKRAEEMLEKESFNLRSRSTQYTNYTRRII